MPSQTVILTPHEVVWAFVILIACICALFLALNAAYDDAARNPQPRRRKQRPPEPRTRELDFGIIPVPMEVIALTHNKETACRLYDDLRERYPYQPDEWVWDKIKWDIIRDRH